MRNRSLSNTSWFYGKKCTIEKGNSYLIENRLSKNGMGCASGNYNDTCHTCAKGFLDLKFN